MNFRWYHKNKSSGLKSGDRAAGGMVRSFRSVEKNSLTSNETSSIWLQLDLPPVRSSDSVKNSL